MSVETFSIKELIESSKKNINLDYGMVISIRSKTCLIVEHDCEYKVLLISLDDFKEYEEFRNFQDLLLATSDIKVLAKLSL